MIWKSTTQQARSSNVIAVDTSSLAKVVLLEEEWESVPLTTDTATLDYYSIVEVSSSVWKAVLQERIGEGDAKKKIEALKMLAGALTIFKAEDYLERGFEIALKEKITVYDAIYIALAEDKGATLFTSDRRQYNAAKRYARTIFVG